VTKTWLHDDRGSGGVEAGIAVTALLTVAFFLVGAMRITGTSGDTSAAARAAARAAAGQYDVGRANAAAQSVAAAELSSRGLACQGLSVNVNADLKPGGIVTVDVTCTVNLSDVVFAGFPGTRQVSGRGVEAVDVVRGGS
jgi:Flp pilus assembly protein TadG